VEERIRGATQLEGLIPLMPLSNKELQVNLEYGPTLARHEEGEQSVSVSCLDTRELATGPARRLRVPSPPPKLPKAATNA